MADSESHALPLPDSQVPSESSQSSGGASKSCVSCKLPVKDHPGPHGLAKCLIGKLISRVEELEAGESRLMTRLQEQE